MNPAYVPALVETRQVYGISMEQRRNDALISASTFTNVVSKNTTVSRDVFDSSVLVLTSVIVNRSLPPPRPT